MDYVELLIVFGLMGLACGLAGAVVCRHKGRRAVEGFAWGFLLGAIGVAIVVLLPAGRKPARRSRHAEGWQAPPEESAEESAAFNYLVEANQARRAIRRTTPTGPYPPTR
jgi:hypothetical protein